ncbi:MAG TPA: energy transducer TonB [Candidatus Acidoferrales bacterium]|nr:energy transducer TonB [Candidatus Acidoferrales bacterium]
MRRIILFATVVLLSALAPAALNAQAQKRPEFEPPQILMTADVVYPITSVSWGTVVLEVNISANGNVESVKVIRGIPSLTETALTAVKKWKFRPAKFDGRAVPSKLPVAFAFVPPNVGPRP